MFNYSFINIYRTPQPKPHICLKYIIKKNKKIMKDKQTNTDSTSFYDNNNTNNKRRISYNNNNFKLYSLKNACKLPSSSIFISNLYNNNLKSKKKHNNNSIGMPYIKNKYSKINKNEEKIDDIFPLKKRIFSTYKRKLDKSILNINDNVNNTNNTNNTNNNTNNNNTNNNANKNIIINKNINNIEIVKDKKRKRNNLVDIENYMTFFQTNIKKKINTFFNNKYLQENTDIFKIGKSLSNNNNLNIKFSEPINSNNDNVIVDNNISLENTFKKQTVSNFNNKYYFKFKTNNLKEKETIKKLFLLLKKHKNSELDKNNDFLVFHLYKQKKMRKREINKAILEEFSSPCAYIGRNYDNGFINKEYYTNKNDYETSIIQKQKENKMISIKSLQMNI